MSPQLPNYLRSHRKRSALSQDDVAFLLGAQSGAKMCRYERFVREPSLRTALAFEVIFQKSLREIFAGLYENVEEQIAARANILNRTVDAQQTDGHLVRKRDTLAKLSAITVKKPNR